MYRGRMIITTPLNGLSRDRSQQIMVGVKADYISQSPDFNLVFLEERENGAETLELIYEHIDIRIYQLNIPVGGLSRQNAEELVTRRMDEIEKEMKLTSTERLITTPFGESGKVNIKFMN